MLISRRSFMLGMASLGLLGGKGGSPILNGEQCVTVVGYDWGPAVTKTVLKLDQQVADWSVNASTFEITETKETFDWATFSPVHVTSSAPRTILNAYVCDEKGNEVCGASDMIAIEMGYSPNEGSPYCYDVFKGVNTVCSPYDLEISLAEGSVLATKGGTQITTLNIAPACDVSKADMPQLKRVSLSGKFTGSDGKTLTYGSYHPSNSKDGKKHPLVIWLHGAGEGGTDTTVNILGNKVTALYGEEFQEVMGGAYVLTPQTPSFWLAYNEDGDWGDNPGVSSIYHKTLMELIKNYVAGHPAIDPDRIYVGGCSNGGYMTMDLILHNPDYFAAAYPICEAYRDAGISDAELEGIKDLPVWFIYADNDTVVNPDNFERPTIARLRAIGANVHTSIFPDVHDTSGLYTDEDGNPHQYQGHWSWLYFFNNECEEDGVNMWKWMAAQSK